MGFNELHAAGSKEVDKTSMRFHIFAGSVTISKRVVFKYVPSPPYQKIQTRPFNSFV